MLFERWQFYYGPRVTYWAMKESRIPLLLADGSAAVRATAILGAPAVPPGTPNNFPPGSISNIVVGHYRWTRAGIFGRDYGPEVPGF